MTEGWKLQAKWPVEKGDEITSAHFEDLRKMMWSIDLILEPDDDVWDEDNTYSVGDVVWWMGEEWICIKDTSIYYPEPGHNSSYWREYPEPWDKNKIYHQYDKTLFNLFDYLDIKKYSRWEEYAWGDFVRKGSDVYVSLKNANQDNSLSEAEWWSVIVDTQFHYILGSYSCKGIPPVKHSSWFRVARRDKYCDFNTNSGCYNFYGQGPAYLQLPPQVNKYTQTVMTHRPTGYVVPAELMFGKHQETPIELAINRGNFNGMQALITGPIGARYVEYHPYTGHGIMFHPFYYPYYVSDGGVGSAGVPYLQDKYYDRKLQGYQSFIEGFVDGKGNKFKWPLEGQDLQDALANEQEPFWTMRDKSWLCNASAFEKALELTGDYDWYLDLKFPPDPDMYKLTNRPLWRKGAWRKTWKYSFGCPLGLMWPQEKGDPPYLNAGGSWWADYSNCQKAYQEALNKLDVNDIKHIAERHWPMWVPRADELAKKQTTRPEKEVPDDDFQEMTDHLLKMYEEMLRVIKGAGVPHWAPDTFYDFGDYVQHWAVYYRSRKPHTSSLSDLNTQASWDELWKKVEYWQLYEDLTEWEPKVDMCFEIAAGLVNQMKQVLECLKWVAVHSPSSSSVGSYHFAEEFGPGYFLGSHCEDWSWGQFTSFIAGLVASDRGDPAPEVGLDSPVKNESDCCVLGCASVRKKTREWDGDTHPSQDSGATEDSDCYCVKYTFSGTETRRLLKHTLLYGKKARIVMEASGNYDPDYYYPDPFPGGVYSDDIVGFGIITIGNIFTVSAERTGDPTKGWIEVPYLARDEEFEVELGYSGGRWAPWSAPTSPGTSWFIGQVKIIPACAPMLVEIDPLKADLGCEPVE